MCYLGEITITEKRTVCYSEEDSIQCIIEERTVCY